MHGIYSDLSVDDTFKVLFRGATDITGKCVRYVFEFRAWLDAFLCKAVMLLIVKAAFLACPHSHTAQDRTSVFNGFGLTIVKEKEFAKRNLLFKF